MQGSIVTHAIPAMHAYPRLYAAWPGLPCFNFQGQVPSSSNYSQLELSTRAIPLLIWLYTHLAINKYEAPVVHGC